MGNADHFDQYLIRKGDADRFDRELIGRGGAEQLDLNLIRMGECAAKWVRNCKFDLISKGGAEL